jgi:hypothetical protein
MIVPLSATAYNRATLSIGGAAMPALVAAEYEVTVPGTWYSRPAKANDCADWQEGQNTPARVRVRENEIYHLFVNKDAVDGQLHGLARLAGLPQLRLLDLCGCRRITDAALAEIGRLTQLQNLDLSKCEHISDEGLRHLAGLTQLQWLDLSGCPQITDAGLASLAALVRLQSLDLAGCHQITDAGLAQLQALPRLQKLFISRCPRVTEAGIHEFEATLPLCMILH